MRTELIPEPWRAFLADIDAALLEAVSLHCLGGFAVSLFYGVARPTRDVDVVDVRPHHLKQWLATIAGPGSTLAKKHKVYLQIVTVATLPESYEERLVEVALAAFRKLRLFVLEPHDLVLSKLSRNSEVDTEDVLQLDETQHLDLEVLAIRYQSELRPHLLGEVRQHDLTLKLWVDAITERRSRSGDR